MDGAARLPLLVGSENLLFQEFQVLPIYITLQQCCVDDVHVLPQQRIASNDRTVSIVVVLCPSHLKDMWNVTNIKVEFFPTSMTKL